MSLDLCFEASNGTLGGLIWFYNLALFSQTLLGVRLSYYQVCEYWLRWGAARFVLLVQYR